MLAMRKFPRTPHLQGSALQSGDSPENMAFSRLAGRHLVVEEKFDGANCGLFFNSDGALMLQNRGHILSGGPRERQFDVLKSWAGCHADALRDRLQDRYVLYGDWMAILHSVYYDALPHFLLAFDILDRQRSEKEAFFLSTAARRELLEGMPVCPVEPLYEGLCPRRPESLLDLIGPSSAKSPLWRDAFEKAVLQARGADYLEQARAETFGSDEMEGLYIKIEEGERTVGRVKFVQPGFTQAIQESGSHWMDRPPVPNSLAPEVDIFAPGPFVSGRTTGPDQSRDQ